jgi:hypothetical protein
MRALDAEWMIRRDSRQAVVNVALRLAYPHDYAMSKLFHLRGMIQPPDDA